MKYRLTYENPSSLKYVNSVFFINSLLSYQFELAIEISMQRSDCKCKYFIYIYIKYSVDESSFDNCTRSVGISEAMLSGQVKVELRGS